MKQIHVVAGVIRDARGRILLARRTVGRDLAGLWEFPGGKVEPGESPEDALVRELREELGIEASVGEALLRVPQQYPDKRLVLDVRRVTFRGVPRGLDGQALAWSPLQALGKYPMPPGDRPVVAALTQPDRYLVTPSPGEGDDDPWLESLSHALSDGVQRVQLRAPGVDASRWRVLAARAVALCRGAKAQVLVNGDIALAGHLGVGVHLRSAQLRGGGTLDALAGIRSEGQLIGASCHDGTDLRDAEAAGCDFAVLGPLKPTTSHPGQPGLGWEAFALLREHVSLPIYAIGGMSPEDIPGARAHGGQGIAAIRALWPAGP